jgi:CDP-diacylglycerol--glycerol-3-phosphate 3-phosphatidyltransferase
MTTEKPTPPDVKKNWSFEQFMRQTFKGILDTIAAFLLKIGLTPNLVTSFGLVLTIAAAVFAALGKFSIAGLILLIGAPLDAVDGAMARKLGTPTRFGGFFDSVMDRYAELFMLGGLLVYYNGKGDTTTALLVYIAAAGSLMVSYTRARAEGLQLNARVGFFSRLERMISLILFLLIGKPVIAIWLIAILANFTAIQRIIFVYRQAKDSKLDAG